MKIIPSHPILFLLVLAVSFHHGNAQTAKKPPMFSSELSGGDMQFLASASEQGRVQAALGELATTHAQSADVKAFGQALANENAVQSEKIKLLAIKKKYTLSENQNAAKNPVAEKLEKLEGLKFDKAYVVEMLQQQQNYVAIFERATQSSDPDIKAFAVETLPVIKQHLAFLSHSAGSAAPASTPRFRIDTGDPATSGSRKN